MDTASGTVRVLELVPGGSYDARLFKLSRGKLEDAGELKAVFHVAVSSSIVVECVG